MSHHLLTRHRRYVIVLSMAGVIFWLNTQWIIPSASLQTPTPTDDGHACVSCHKSIVQTHLRTAHYLSSTPAGANTIKGSFRNGRNRYVYNDHMEVNMEKKNGVFLQTALFNGSLYESEAFDIVIGWRKGQSYLYWDNNRLFQLPVSWYAPTDSWCNSPGYPTNIIYFNKQVPGQCMECHAAAANLYTDNNGAVTYDRNTIVLGIGCGRCHGDPARHIAWHTTHPADSLIGRFIINARHLTRQQRLDACALCHSGFRKPLQPSFTFQVGDTLDKFSEPNYDTAATATLDVHGNQYGLLTSSKCFIRSSALDCSSCHNVHVDETGKMETYSQRCITCHTGKDQPSCASPAIRQMKEVNNCIDCHMPVLPSNKIILQINGSSAPVHDLVRTHRVAIYPEISEAWLKAHGH
ncbi:MAG TPA: cytochrome c3 family protein [Puia sp.]|nr:cytochrome c3 family protein [Puia sp.]